MPVEAPGAVSPFVKDIVPGSQYSEQGENNNTDPSGVDEGHIDSVSTLQRKTWRMATSSTPLEQCCRAADRHGLINQASSPAFEKIGVAASKRKLLWRCRIVKNPTRRTTHGYALALSVSGDAPRSRLWS